MKGLEQLDAKASPILRIMQARIRPFSPKVSQDRVTAGVIALTGVKDVFARTRAGFQGFSLHVQSAVEPLLTVPLELADDFAAAVREQFPETPLLALRIEMAATFVREHLTPDEP